MTNPEKSPQQKRINQDNHSEEEKGVCTFDDFEIPKNG